MNLKALWYCTKSDLKLYKTRDGDYITLKAKDNIFGYEELNGKIVAMSDFDCEEIIHTFENGASVHHDYSTKTLDNMQILLKSCLLNKTLTDYLGCYDYDKNNNVVGYAIHIKNLTIFDKPKKISDVYKIVDVGGMLFTDTLKKAPQNMMYVSVNPWEYSFYNPEDKRVLISVHPEWLAMILNGLKDVELRRKVLKEMKEC